MKTNKKTGEIFLYGVIGGKMYGGDIDEGDVVNALEEIGSKRATVRINSPGGVVDTGIAIYNVLKSHKPGVDVVVDSLAASIASVIALAGEDRATADGSRWMIHRARSVVSGSAAEIRKRLEQTDVYDAAMVEIYSQYLGKSPEEIGELLDAETWYTSQQAIDVGLATRKVAAAKKVAPRVAAWFANPPADLVAASQAQVAVLREQARIRSRYA
jgi:ATP-dependent Clp protease protease subunit